MKFAEIIFIAAAIMFGAEAANATSNDTIVEVRWKQENIVATEIVFSSPQ